MGAAAHIHSERLRSNWASLKALSKQVNVAPVVKADAYGLGIEALAPLLVKHGARQFFVAWPHEGRRLREVLTQAGHEDALIAVFYGLSRETLADFRRYRLQPVLSTQEHIRLYRQQQDVLPQAMLQLETGMHRSGYSGALEDAKGLPLAGVFSHMACADTPEHPLNAAQRQRWRAALRHFPSVPASLSASWAVVSAQVQPEEAFVRVGAALYGAIDHPSVTPIVELHAPILEIRTVRSGDSVGYGAAYIADSPKVIATLGIGYADGYPRALEGKGRALIAGQVCPLVGRVSMDLVTVDVSSIPPAALEQATDAVLYGGHYTINDAATDAGTIGYEIVTRLGNRVRRVYVS